MSIPSEERSQEKPRQRIYSPKLLGVKGSECTIPKCRAPGKTISTGWLEYGSLGWWCMEFNCPDHGPQLSGGGPWTALINEVLKDQGISPSA